MESLSNVRTAVVGVESGTISGAISRVNGLLGKQMQSPRDDLHGTVEVFEVLSIDIHRTSSNPLSYYAAAVVSIGVRKETLDVEKEFFRAVPTEID